MSDEIPPEVRGPKRMADMTDKEIQAQQSRIAKWLIKRAAERAAKKFEEGQK